MWRTRFIVIGLLLFIGIIFLASGVTKLTAQEYHELSFKRWGYPLLLMYIVGLAEVCGALMLITSVTRKFGLALLFSIMVGAIYTHFMVKEYAMVAAPLFFIILMIISVWQLRKLKKLTSKGPMPTDDIYKK